MIPENELLNTNVEIETEASLNYKMNFETNIIDAYCAGKKCIEL